MKAIASSANLLVLGGGNLIAKVPLYMDASIAPETTISMKNVYGLRAPTVWNQLGGTTLLPGMKPKIVLTYSARRPTGVVTPSS